MLDPRLFLGIGGPTPAQPMLPPGFRPPGPGPGAPMQQQQIPGLPSFGVPGMGMMPRKDGGPFGGQSGDALKQTAAGTSVAETTNPFSTDPTGNVGGPGTITETGAVRPGSFWDFLRSNPGLIPPSGYGWAP